MRKAKIVCTLDPASETKEVIFGLCKAGMNMARYARVARDASP